nr:RHS repeat-associated core domain-containing protein [Gilliamella bombi]
MVSKKHSKHGQTDYRHDEHGRTQTKQSIGATQHYHYDAEHRLSEVRIEQLNKTERYRYLYDALGRRIEKQKLDREGKPYNRTRFLWDGLRMIQETGPNHPTSLYIYTDQNNYEPLARIDKRGNDPERVMYFHTDLNGCPEELTDANGEILWECSFQLWGKRIHEIEHESVEQNLRYQEQYLDRETGLHYNTFRYYDPDIGRFTQPDPIGLLGGLNLYQYAPNGLTWIDPWGLTSCKPVKAGEGGKFSKLNARGVKGDKLTPHHMPQAAAGFTSKADGGALVITESEHYLTRTYGYKGAITKVQDFGLSFRQVLAKDIKDIRNIVGSKYDEGIRDIIKYYKTNYPELMKK